MSVDNTYKDLLHKLISGTISDTEKWQLEKASLDDPFLADALEGYYNNKNSSPDSIKTLSRKIQAPTRSTRSLGRRWLSIAASLLILFGASFWMFHSSKSGQMEVQTAASKKSEKIEERTITDSNKTTQESEKTEQLEPTKKKSVVTEKSSPTPAIAEVEQNEAMLDKKKSDRAGTNEDDREELLVADKKQITDVQNTDLDGRQKQKEWLADDAAVTPESSKSSKKKAGPLSKTYKAESTKAIPYDEHNDLEAEIALEDESIRATGGSIKESPIPDNSNLDLSQAKSD